MPSKIDVDPLLVALFDLPASIQAPSNDNARSNVHGAPSSGRNVRRSNPADDGVETDNTSLLHGETISLTDEEYSDAVSHLPPPDNRTSSFTTFRPNMVSLPERLPVGTSSNNEYAGSRTQRHPMMLPVSKGPDEFVTRGGGASPSLKLNTQHVTRESKPSNKQTSPKREKKRKSAAIKSLKKLVGRNSKSSANALAMTSSFDEADSRISSPSTDPYSYGGDSENSPNIPHNIVDDGLSLKRLSTLKSNIGRIRSSIHSLEGDLIATRNELARAHQHLHLATMELADLQRAALETDIGLYKLEQQQQHGGVSISPSALAAQLSPLNFFEADMSTRSSIRSDSSSDRLHYFTPKSSIRGSWEDSDCFTPRSTLSCDSFSSSNDKDNIISTPILDDLDRTPLTKNGKPKHRRRFKFDSGVKVSNNVLTYGMESNSIDTPSTDASTQDNTEESMAGLNGNVSKKATFYKQPSFIRAHDLALANGYDNSALVTLHETNVSDVVNALFEKGLDLAMDESERWNPEHGTGKSLSKRAKKLMNGEIDGPIGQWPHAAHGDEVLVWSSKCPHGGHGSEYPMVKARGLIPTSAQQMVELLLDSGRVKQYNKMSLGRTDEVTFAEGVDRPTKCPATGIHGELKIVRSKSQPPVIRKPVELRLLLHARRLPSEGEEGAKYLTIGRSVWETEHGTAEAEDTSATRCEMLLSVNLIRDVQGVSGEQWCEISSITHGVSPGIPISIGRRIGLSAAAKYIRDIRAVFK